jgi:CheY-like chemotaxis protein
LPEGAGRQVRRFGEAIHPGGVDEVIRLEPDHWPPTPWINVLANPRFGCLASDAGLGTTWSRNSQQHRLTPWSNDPVSDPPSEVLYVCDEDSGQVWSPTALPIRTEGVHRVRHGAGYTVYEHASHGIDLQLSTFVAVEDPEVAVKTGGRLGREGVPFILVTDLGMPTSGGSSFHGGFEVVKRLWKMNLRPPVLMMTESLSPALQLRARQMKIGSFVFKPGLSKLNPKQFEADLLTFAQRLVVEALPRLEATLHAEPQEKPLPAAPGGPARPTAGPGGTGEEADELARQFTILQRRLADLRRPTEAKEISLLVMRVAREYFERALLFLVRHEELKGLGGFGPAPKGHHLNLLAREIVIPLGEPSIFRDVVTAGQTYEGPLPDGRTSAYLMGKVGRFQSAEVALLPLVTHRETIAVLFGDNPETGRPIGRVAALEVFVNQAGVAFENAFLQRKIQSLQG